LLQFQSTIFEKEERRCLTLQASVTLNNLNHFTWFKPTRLRQLLRRAHEMIRTKTLK